MIRMQQKFDSKRYVKVQVKMSWSFESVYAKVIRLSYIQTLPIKLAPLIWMISSCYLWLIRQGLPVQLIYGSILMMYMFMNTRERNINVHFESCISTVFQQQFLILSYSRAKIYSRIKFNNHCSENAVLTKLILLYHFLI